MALVAVRSKVGAQRLPKRGVGLRRGRVKEEGVGMAGLGALAGSAISKEFAMSLP